MNNNFRVVYMYRQEEKEMLFSDWLSVLLFIDETENVHGGFIFMIYVNGNISYLRYLDHKNGTDKWFNIEGKEVDLDHEFRATV